MNRDLHTGAVALFCLGILLMYAGYLGLRETGPEPVCDRSAEEACP